MTANFWTACPRTRCTCTKARRSFIPATTPASSKAKASKAKQAQSRVKRLAKLAGTEAVRAERAFHINFAEPARLPHSLIRLNHVDAGYPADGGVGGSTVILHDVGFGLEAGDRVGLLGPNGAGKSTLVKTLVGELALINGERVAHPDLKLGYFAQHTVESLHEGQTPLWHLREIDPNAGEQQLRNFLGQWNFVGDRAFESVDGFSGGERARLALALARTAARQGALRHPVGRDGACGCRHRSR